MYQVIVTSNFYIYFIRIKNETFSGTETSTVSESGSQANHRSCGLPYAPSAPSFLLSFLIFPQAPQKCPRCGLPPAPTPLPLGRPMVFIVAINLICAKQEIKKKKKKNIQKRCVELYMISHHLVSDKLLVCQAFARYSVFIVTGTSILMQLVKQIWK